MVADRRPGRGVRQGPDCQEVTAVYRSSGSQLSPIAHADSLGVADRRIRTCVERPRQCAGG